MGPTIDGAELGNRLSRTFPSGGFLRIGLFSAGVASGLFLLGYVVAAVGGIAYLSEPDGYLAGFAVLWTLTALGLGDATYVDVWNRTRPAFAVDDGTYRRVVGDRLARIYDERRILACAGAVWLPFAAAVTAVYLPGSPFREDLVAVLLANDPDPLPPSALRVALYFLLGAANAVLVGAAVNGLANHLGLVRDVADLPFEDVRTAASELEPVGRFTLASATVWFAGVSLVVLWVEAGLSSDLGAATIGLLVLIGSVFFLAPQLVLHDALSDAKREIIAGVRAEYEAMDERIRAADEPAVDLPLRLEVTDRRLESANAIRTWVYDLSSLGGLVAASVIPWLTLVRELVSTIRFGG